jgi:hypothetical protein
MASSQKQAEASQQPPQQPQKKPSVMEEDDEFEDFPVEGRCANAFHPRAAISQRGEHCLVMMLPLTALLANRERKMRAD